MSNFTNIHDISEKSYITSKFLAKISTDQKNIALSAMSNQLLEQIDEILVANKKDMDSAENRLGKAFSLDRLLLNRDRIQKMANDINQLINLDDPVGKVLKEWKRDNGLIFKKITVPLGAVGIIYESRPNVTSDAASLCLKSGNTVVLRGGTESLNSNIAIVRALQDGLREANISEYAIQLIESGDREIIKEMCQMNKYLSCIIPRGGKSLIEVVSQCAKMPVIKHYDGICCLYIDEEADLEMAYQILINGKCQRPSVCNALETVLIHQNCIKNFFNLYATELLKHQIEWRCDQSVFDTFPAIANLGLSLKHATPSDFQTEFLNLTLALKVVNSVEEAITHIELYGSHHSDAIVTKNIHTANQFLSDVDSATVYWNASTRFTDGGEFGFGCEIGISTDKIHARGPMGLEEMTSYKYQIVGNGAVRTT